MNVKTLLFCILFLFCSINIFAKEKNIVLFFENIEGVSNSQLLITMGNAYTSSEYIHYGDIPKRAIVKILKQAFPEEDIDRLLDDTYCIDHELAVKRNGIGHKLSDTVNLFITQNGYNLSAEHTKVLLDTISGMSDEKLWELYNEGIDGDRVIDLLTQTRDKGDFAMHIKDASVR